MCRRWWLESSRESARGTTVRFQPDGSDGSYFAAGRETGPERVAVCVGGVYSARKFSRGGTGEGVRRTWGAMG